MKVWIDETRSATTTAVVLSKVELLRKRAEQGDADAQLALGFMYFDGQSVPQDKAEAVKWFRKAAEQGNAVAQSNMGFAHSSGEGVPQDEAEAAQWFRKAAEQGETYAQSNLGAMYARGEGVPQDYTEALKWASKARVVLRAMLRAGGAIKRQSGTSHRVLAKTGWPDFVFAFHEGR